jgi:hypothetical protein
MNLPQWRHLRVLRVNELLGKGELLPNPDPPDWKNGPRAKAFEEVLAVLDHELPIEGVA